MNATSRFLPAILALGSLLLAACSSDDDNNSNADGTDEGAGTPSPYVAAVTDYTPAPGQFVNVTPAYRDGMTAAAMRDSVARIIVGNDGAGGTRVVSLGGFGGTITMRFDHDIQNIKGQCDLRVYGNAYENNAEPGIILVGNDDNHNGQMDEDEWCEIAGSEYRSPATTHGYTITYSRPETETRDTDYDGGVTTVKHYVRWSDNLGASGWIVKNSFHDQTYYPTWLPGATLTLSGTRLAPNATLDGAIYHLAAYPYGYADNYANTDPRSAIDIDWAVRSDGQPARLASIRYVRVVSAMQQDCGWIGETSTEICGAADLHLLGEHIATPQ